MTEIQMASYHKTPVSSPVLAVLMVIVVEMMFFGGLISAFILAGAGQTEWPPASQPRLPVYITLPNMFMLLISALSMRRYVKNMNNDKSQAVLLNTTLLLGVIFFMVQGYEWIRILWFGIKTSHSLFGSFFYTLIGMHGLHVLAGLIILILVKKYHKSLFHTEKFKSYATASSIFWYFVAGVWPVLYYLIYAN